MLAPRLALAGAATAALVLTGCSQPDAANDNTNSRLTDRTVTPPTVLRTPVRVPTVEPTEPLPGPSNSPETEQE